MTPFTTVDERFRIRDDFFQRDIVKYNKLLEFFELLSKALENSIETNFSFSKALSNHMKIISFDQHNLLVNTLGNQYRFVLQALHSEGSLHGLVTCVFLNPVTQKDEAITHFKLYDNGDTDLTFANELGKLRLSKYNDDFFDLVIAIDKEHRAGRI